MRDHSSNSIKPILIKIVNLLNIKRNKNLLQKLSIDKTYISIINDFLDKFTVPNITQNILNTIIKLGYKISGDDREIVNHIMLTRIYLYTMSELINNNNIRTPSLILNDKLDDKFISIKEIKSYPYKAALYFAIIDLIPDFYYDKLDLLIKDLYRKKEVDYLYFYSVLILALNLNLLLQINTISMEKLFSSRFTYINATILAGVVTKYSLIMQYRSSYLQSIFERIKKYEVDSGALSKVTSDIIMPNFRKNLDYYQLISRTFTVT